MSDPTFSIVVPTFRRPASLRETLTALLDLDYDRDRYEVIVVDDGADEVTAEIVAEIADRGLSLTLEAQNQGGAARARNRGARVARGELLLFCDDDIIVEPSHLRLHVAARERYGDAVVNGAWEFAPAVFSALRTTAFGRYRIELERHFQEAAGGEPLAGDPRSLRMPLLGSWDLALRRELFWKLDGFDEQFPVAGAEDQDFSLRARDAGCLLMLDTRIRCLHNDNRLTLRSYCAREERSALTMPFLAHKHPQEFGEVAYVCENRPISCSDPPHLVIKKLLKLALACGPVLASLHWATGVLEAAHVPSPLLRRVYSTLLGLHLFRGFRRTWT